VFLRVKDNVQSCQHLREGTRDSQSSTTMTETSAAPSSWDVNKVRSGLLNNPSSGQDTRQLLRAFLNGKGHIKIIRQLVAGEQAKLLEIVDQVSMGHCHPPRWRSAKRVVPGADSPGCHE